MRRFLLPGLAVLALAGCGGGSTGSTFPKKVVGTVAQAPSGAAAGKPLFMSNGCGSCHTYEPAGASGKVGPDLDKLAADAQKAGKPLEEYTRTSIEDPNAYVVPGFQPNVMPVFKGTLTDSQIDDLVAYLTKKS